MQQSTTAPRFNHFHRILLYNGRSSNFKGADQSNFITAATTHFESGDPKYNQAVVQACSETQIFRIFIHSGASVYVSACEVDFHEGIKSANYLKFSGLEYNIC